MSLLDYGGLRTTDELIANRPDDPRARPELKFKVVAASHRLSPIAEPSSDVPPSQSGIVMPLGSNFRLCC